MNFQTSIVLLVAIVFSPIWLPIIGVIIVESIKAAKGKSK